MEPPTSRAGSQKANTDSAAHRTVQSDGGSSKQVEAGAEGMASAEHVLLASSRMLPIELLVDIFRHVSSSDVARSARVCRTWHAASKDARIWRHLSFTRLNSKGCAVKAESAQLVQRFKSLGARCDDTVESVDFSQLSLISPQAVMYVVQGLITSVQTLKHIHWSTLTDKDESMPAVAALAGRCPRLETLELCAGWISDSTKFAPQTLTGEVPNATRLRSFSLTVFDFSGSTFNLLDVKATIFDHATTLKFQFADGVSRDVYSPLMRSSTFYRILQSNPAIEKLTVHGLGYDDIGASTLTAPSLASLDLRYSTEQQLDLMLDAPQLRELFIDSQLLPNLTPRSVATLSSLTLHIGRTCDESKQDLIDSIPSQKHAIVGVKGHQGSLKLFVGHEHAKEVLQMLSESFFWPGLNEVEIELNRSAAKQFVSVMAARHVCARGASSEKYVDNIRQSEKKLGFAWPIALAKGSSLLTDAEEIMAAACASNGDVESPPLCAQVQWKIVEHRGMYQLPEELSGWMERLPNVTVTRM